MTFFEPVWLLLALPLFSMLLIWKAPSKTVLFLRIILLALVVMALAGAAVRLPSGSGTAVIVADCSRSMPVGSEKLIEEAADILHSSKEEKHNIGVISFAEKSSIEKIPGTAKFDGLKTELHGGQSNLKDAVESALSVIPYGDPARILLLTDGNWTGENPSSAFAQCATRGIPVDYRIIKRSKAKDLAISGIDAPHTVPSGEFFTVTVNIKSHIRQEIDYLITRNNKKLLAGRLKLTPGENRLFFKDKSNTPHTLRYNLEIKGTSGEADPLPENNRARFIVKVKGQRPVLLVTATKNSGYGKLLKRSDINVDVKLPGELDFTLEELSGYSGIIIENVPAGKMGPAGMATIAELVKNSGTGLLLTGGKNSYGIGGYYNSPLEKILPVSMELKREHRKLSMAIVVALDRSGSMGASAGAGRTKMDLANMAAVEVLKLLSPLDEFGVIAVDSSPHTIVPLTKASDVDSIINKVLHIQSMGGGIFVYEALIASVDMLTKSKSGTRHIILFADAADAEQPGKYQDLLDKATQAGITVSVVGLGFSTDRDALFLQDVALRGNGRCYFSNKPEELPRLFAQDTFVIARNTFIEEPTKVKLTGAMRTISRQNFGKTFKCGGYNLSYLRPGARCGAVSEDEYEAPLISFWHAELGRVLCYTGEIDGEYTGNFAKWNKAGNLLTSMAVWVAGLKGGGLPNNMLITQDVNNGVNIIRLHLDPNRKHDPFRSLPVVTTLTGLPGKVPSKSEHKMKWESPDTLILKIPLHGSETSLSTVKIEKVTPQVLSPVVLPYSPEFKPAKTSSYRTSIMDLAKMTGGVERLDLAGLWQEMPVKIKMASITKWLILAAIIVLLLEVLERRTGLLIKKPLSLLRPSKAVEEDQFVKETSRTKGVKQTGKTAKRRKESTPKKKHRKSEPQTQEESKDDNSSELFNAFDRVKKQSKK